MLPLREVNDIISSTRRETTMITRYPSIYSHSKWTQSSVWSNSTTASIIDRTTILTRKKFSHSKLYVETIVKKKKGKFAIIFALTFMWHVILKQSFQSVLLQGYENFFECNFQALQFKFNPFATNYWIRFSNRATTISWNSKNLLATFKKNYVFFHICHFRHSYINLTSLINGRTLFQIAKETEQDISSNSVSGLKVAE